MPSKKKRKRTERPTIHPRNKYSDNPPDFSLLASRYPSFEPYVFYSREGRPRIDWTDYNATRELTRVLLLHDHGINWWIPDGQLCPTVPNRSNYIHWVEDLLSSNIIANSKADKDQQVVRGFDIGTGANCIYPLLGASLLGWTFVGSDVTDVAIEWAEKNVKNNPHISHLIEIRKADSGKEPCCEEESGHNQLAGEESDVHIYEIGPVKAEHPHSSPLKFLSDVNTSYHGPPILLGVVKDGEKFDFCMCNPPFFGTMEEAGLNPKTSCGGTPEEMVCPGGEEAFVSRIIQDSVQLKQSFWWYTSMVGKKSSLKVLMSKLRDVGVTVVKTTEFVQGQTCRWGLAWSFMPAARNIVSSNVAKKNGFSFMLEGLERQYSAIHVLQSIESFFCAAGASCKTNVSTFIIDVTAPNDHWDAILNNELRTANGSGFTPLPSTDLAFRVSVFQQIPGTLLIRGSVRPKESPAAGAFSLTFGRLEEFLKDKFCK